MEGEFQDTQSHVLCHAMKKGQLFLHLGRIYNVCQSHSYFYSLLYLFYVQLDSQIDNYLHFRDDKKKSLPRTGQEP